MKEHIAYEDAIDLLDADHKSVKKLFLEFAELCQDESSVDRKSSVARQICDALKSHTQIEEEIFYPAVDAAIPDANLINEARAEHAEVAQIIARIEGMMPSNRAFDATVMQLGKLVEQHVLKEREQIFLKASRAALDLRDMTRPLLKRRQQLAKQAAAVAVKESA